MSTTFGIYKNNKNIKLIDDCLPEEYYISEAKENFIVVAFSGNNTGFYWKNELAPFLLDEIKVYPLDNSAQGIYTIGDIKKEMKDLKKIKPKTKELIVKLESYDPTAIIIKSESFSMNVIDDPESMIQDKLYLYIDKHAYHINTSGEIIDKLS